MRGFNEEEIAAYNKVRERHPELKLPKYRKNFEVKYAEAGITTICVIKTSAAPRRRYGWSVFSPIDQRKFKRPQVSSIGRNNAFSRALHSPLVWTD